MIIEIPFAGFYESIWDSEQDSVVDSIVESLHEEHPLLEASDIQDIVYRHCNF